MLTLTSLKIWLRWKQAGSGGSGLDLTSLVTIDLASTAALDLVSQGVGRGGLHSAYRAII